jgi:hypothetical protein
MENIHHRRLLILHLFDYFDQTGMHIASEIIVSVDLAGLGTVFWIRFFDAHIIP